MKSKTNTLPPLEGSEPLSEHEIDLLRNRVATLQLQCRNREVALRADSGYAQSAPSVDGKDLREAVKILAAHLATIECEIENFSLSDVANPSPESRLAIANESGFTISETEFAALGVLDTEWNQCLEGILAYTHDSASKAHREQAAQIAAVVANPEKISEHPAWSLEDFREEFHAKQSAFRQAQRQVSDKAFEIVKPHLARFHASASELAGRIEKAERAVAESLAIGYETSKTVKTIRKVANIALRESRRDSARSTRPAVMAAMLPIGKPAAK